MGSCIEWDGYTRNGYGMVTHNGHQVYLHRLTVAEALGWEAIDGRVVRHTCDNKRCYNLDHLVVGTQADNVHDMHDRGRARNGRERTHCARGHEYTPENLYERKDRPGHRECRACRREATAKYEEARQ
jgi:hypothetical protein